MIIKNGLIIIPNKITKVLSKNHFVRLIKELVKESNISWRRNKWKSLIQWVGTSKTGSTYFINNKWTILRNRDHFILQFNLITPITLFLVSSPKPQLLYSITSLIIFVILFNMTIHFVSIKY